jgi:hypothetical protein
MNVSGETHRSKEERLPLKKISTTQFNPDGKLVKCNEFTHAPWEVPFPLFIFPTYSSQAQCQQAKRRDGRRHLVHVRVHNPLRRHASVFFLDVFGVLLVLLGDVARMGVGDDNFEWQSFSFERKTLLRQTVQGKTYLRGGLHRSCKDERQR